MVNELGNTNLKVGMPWDGVQRRLTAADTRVLTYTATSDGWGVREVGSTARGAS